MMAEGWQGGGVGLRERSEWSLPLYQPDAAKSSMPQLPSPLVKVLKTSGAFTRK